MGACMTSEEQSTSYCEVTDAATRVDAELERRKTKPPLAVKLNLTTEGGVEEHAVTVESWEFVHESVRRWLSIMNGSCLVPQQVTVSGVKVSRGTTWEMQAIEDGGNWLCCFLTALPCPHLVVTPHPAAALSVVAMECREVPGHGFTVPMHSRALHAAQPTTSHVRTPTVMQHEVHMQHAMSRGQMDVMTPLTHTTSVTCCPRTQA